MDINREDVEGADSALNPIISPQPIEPRFTDPSQWRVPKREFGNAIFIRENVNNAGTATTGRELTQIAEEWKIAPICFNPNSPEIIATTANLTADQRRDLLRRLNPNSEFFDSSLPYRAIQFNTSLVSSNKVNTVNNADWFAIMNFWAYPNGEFTPISTFDNSSLYISFINFPPNYGNPQKPFLDRLNTRYQFLQYEGDVFATTTANAIVRFGSSNGTNFRGGRGFVSKTFPNPGSYTCNVAEFGSDPAPGLDKQCELFVGNPDFALDDILQIFPRPPLPSQTTTKPYVRYGSIVPTKTNNVWPNINPSEERWIWPRYFRSSYRASDMQCAISKKPNQRLRNTYYQTFTNGYRFRNNDKLELIKLQPLPLRNAGTNRLVANISQLNFNYPDTWGLVFQWLPNNPATIIPGEEVITLSNFTDPLLLDLNGDFRIYTGGIPGNETTVTIRTPTTSALQAARSFTFSSNFPQLTYFKPIPVSANSGEGGGASLPSPSLAALAKEDEELAIQVSCNPGTIQRDSNSLSYVNTMVNYCGGNSNSFYQDSRWNSDPNLNRTDEEGNPLGLGTIQRWDSETCKTFTKLNLVASANNFRYWCKDIRNWTNEGGCFNMANSVTNETQQSVNDTLQQFCTGTALDSTPCLTYCFSEITNNLDCSSNLGDYCKKVLREEINERVSLNTNVSSSVGSTTKNAYTSNPTNKGYNSNAKLKSLPDKIEVKLSNDTIDRSATTIVNKHPQCACFLPTFAYEAFFDRLTQAFPPSPQLNAFLLTTYRIPNCAYPACYTQTRFRPRGVLFPDVKDVIQIEEFTCPKGSKLEVKTYDPPKVDNQQIAPRTRKYTCELTKEKKEELDSQSKEKINPRPGCRDRFTEIAQCANSSYNSVSCTGTQPPCERKSTVIVGAQCPEVISCIQNSVVRITGRGERVTVNLLGQVNVTNICNLKLDRFSRYVDTTVISAINITESIWDLCYNPTVADTQMTLNLVRASTTGGGPAIPLPICEFNGYFSITTDTVPVCILTVVNIVSGSLPSPVDNPSRIPMTNTIKGPYVLPNTLIQDFYNTPSGNEFRSYVVSGTNYALGTVRNPISLIVQANNPDTTPIVIPSFYKAGDGTKSVNFNVMDRVHLYETSIWLNLENAVPTKFTGTLNVENKTLTVTNNFGPICPGLLNEVNGILDQTEITELVSGTGRPFQLNTVGSVWKVSIKTNKTYPTNIIGPVEMFLTPYAVNRWVTGVVTAVYSSTTPTPNPDGGGNLLQGQMVIKCLQTNELQNQLLWSNSATDLRTRNANSQLATYWCITKDDDDDVTPGGDTVNEDTDGKIYNPSGTTGIENQPILNNKIVSESSSTVLIIIIVVIMLFLGIGITFLVVRNKKKVIKAMNT